MTRKKNASISVLIIVLGFTIVSLTIGVPFIPFLQAGIGEGCGYNVISLDNVDFRSNDPLLNLRDSFLVTMQLSPGSNECTYGRVSAPDFNAKSPEDINADFWFRMEALDQTCSYDIQGRVIPGRRGENYESVHRVFLETQQCERTSGGCNVYLSEAAKQDNYVYASVNCYDIWGFNCEVLAAYSEPIGWYGQIGNPQYLFPVEISLENPQGVISSGELSYNKRNTILKDASGNVKAYGEWNGNIAGGVNCPEPSGNFIGVWNIRDAQWNIVSKTFWDDYEGYDEGQFRSCMIDAEKLLAIQWKSQVSSCIATYNQKAASVNEKEQLVQWDWAGAHSQDTTGTGNNAGALVLTAAGPLNFPQVTLHIVADWLGIFSPVGKPSIVGVRPSSLNFEAGTAYLFVNVKNTGTASGSFTVEADCSGSFSGGSQTRAVGSGETIEFKVSVSNTDCPATQHTQQYCDISVSGKTETDYWPTPIPVTCSSLPECSVEGAQKCSSNSESIQECNDGTWRHIATCEFGCNSIGPTCRPDDDGNGGNGTGGGIGEFLHNLFGGISQWLSTMLGGTPALWEILTPIIIILGIVLAIFIMIKAGGGGSGVRVVIQR